ncbi:MAG: polysaccharide pyruvyl transferase family protein [bacterium]
MKKIGLLTYFWDHNPGTFLQAYATLEALKKRFPKDHVELINYKLRKVPFTTALMHRKPAELIEDLRRHYKYKDAQRKYLPLGSKSLITWDYHEASHFIKSLKYDLIVVGSDTLLDFRPDHLKRGTAPVYWLHPGINAKKIMCGSSAKAWTYEELTKEQRTILKGSIKDFDLLGVRDEATYNLMKALGGDDRSRLYKIPDPTFSFEIDYSFAESLVKKRKIDFSKPSVMLSLPEWYKPVHDLASYYRSRGFQIIKLEFARYPDLCLHGISPFEWAGVYRYFDLVITDRFHGTVFSLKNGTPVVSIICRKDLVTSTGNSKYYSLLEPFGLHRTNIVDGMSNLHPDHIIEVTERVRQNFPKIFVQQKVQELKGAYNAFVDQIPSILG